jgi:hypothetical protein
MKIFILPLFFCSNLLIWNSCQKENLVANSFFETHTITSTHLNKDYTIHILYPPNYTPNKTYKTLFLLDANDYFQEMVAVVQTDYLDHTILIGIDYNKFDERSSDFTYPADTRIPTSGQAKNYIQFLNKELLPYIANDLAIQSSDETLLGHSLTGYFATYLLFQQEHPNPFEHIIAASPSLWWGNAYIFELEEAFSQQFSPLNATFFMTMGDLEGVMMNGHFNAFGKILESRSYQDSTFQLKSYTNVSHRNSPILSFKDGLSFIH